MTTTRARTMMPRFFPSLMLVFSLASYTLLRSNLMSKSYKGACTISRKENTTAVQEATNQDAHHSMETDEKYGQSLPKVVWLASYPNSGTSYTMTMVQRATNLATATHYGAEVMDDKMLEPTAVYHQSPDGPFWDASGKIGKPRPLPSKYIMTKTHCGGRCVKCPADEYVTDQGTFLAACEKTSGFRNRKRFESASSISHVAKVIHLVRNPFDNVIARFHLEQKHIVAKNPGLESFFPRNATGFRRWCADLDKTYSKADKHYFSSKQRKLMSEIPCHAEFFKYIQWHNLLIEVIGVETLVVFYEDYHTAQNSTAQKIFNFLEQEAIDELRPFRPPPTYSDHFLASERAAVALFLKDVSSSPTWTLVHHYFESFTASTS